MKRLALGVLLSSIMMNAFAYEVRYFTLPNTTTVDGQTYCDAAWPGSQYFGIRMGNYQYYYIACKQ
ncbi:hypothetical protein [Chitiniphilus eburneus]|uniref:Uncharacterized protein n=1 Tax=Chitiniphilus eburneus TaxID=2571148 RepID=A0A4U0PZT0_9NEIS|nr:hypothetical protein [Chitiniphilus eburneus]TJZ74203.1 hypothetical protein FAZ21_07890 [Chitiniphilus eburneus]